MKQEKRLIWLERNGPGGIDLTEMACNPADFQSPVPKQHMYVYFEDKALGLRVGAWDTAAMQGALGRYPVASGAWEIDAAGERIRAAASLRPLFDPGMDKIRCRRSKPSASDDVGREQAGATRSTL